jgi:hypothetical protein
MHTSHGAIEAERRRNVMLPRNKKRGENGELMMEDGQGLTANGR